MNLKMFEYWLEEMFFPSTTLINLPLLLVMDGYSSHVSLKIINLLKQNRSLLDTSASYNSRSSTS